MRYLRTFNNGSYTIDSFVKDTPIKLKFDYNERILQWVLTITTGNITLLGGKALTPDSILSITNLDLGLNFTVYPFSIRPTSTPIAQWAGYYYIAIGD